MVVFVVLAVVLTVVVLPPLSSLNRLHLQITQAVVSEHPTQGRLAHRRRCAKQTGPVSSMYGEMVQKERDAIMAEFRGGQSRVLITTDVWARGIDVQQVSLVINYDLPCVKRNPTLLS